MNLPQQQRDTLLSQLADSGINPTAAERIRVLLTQPELGADELDEIRNLISDDIDADMEATAPGWKEWMNSDPEYQALVKEAQDGSEAFAKEAEEDTAFIAEQTKVLDEATNDLNTVASQNNLADVKTRLGLN